MRFRDYLKIDEIQVGKIYWVDFRDPLNREWDYVGRVKILKKQDKPGELNYWSLGWFRSETLDKYRNKTANLTPLYIDYKSVKYEVSN